PPPPPPPERTADTAAPWPPPPPPPLPHPKMYVMLQVPGLVQVPPLVKTWTSTEPPPGVAHVPSPRQNVDELALVPLFRLLTLRLPVTPFARLTCAQAGLLDVPVFER